MEKECYLKPPQNTCGLDSGNSRSPPPSIRKVTTKPTMQQTVSHQGARGDKQLKQPATCMRTGPPRLHRSWTCVNTQENEPSTLQACTHLVHRVGEEGLQGAALAGGLLFVALEEGVELVLLLVLGQHLQAVVVVAHILLVDAQHGQQHVKKVTCTTQFHR